LSRALLGEDSSAVGLAVSAETNVSALSPAFTPGVLDFPVVRVLAAVSSHTNKKDTMIKVGSASAGQNTSAVKLEGILVSFNSNGDRALAKSRFEGILVIGGNISVACDRVDLGALIFNAGSTSLGLTTGIWVVVFSAESSLSDDEFEAIVHKTTVASIVLFSVAVNEFLFRKDSQLSGLDGISGFNGSGDGERPARSTRSLVLDWGNFQLVDPVN